MEFRVNTITDHSMNFQTLESSTVLNTLRTGAFKLFKCTLPGSKQFKSTFIMCFFKYL